MYEHMYLQILSIIYIGMKLTCLTYFGGGGEDLQKHHCKVELAKQIPWFRGSWGAPPRHDCNVESAK